MAAREALEGIHRAGTTDATKWVAAMEGHRFDTLKQQQGYWRDWDHQAIHDPLAIEAIPPAEWKIENQYFKSIASADGEKIAPTKAENPGGLRRIKDEKIVTRAGYSPKEA
jgi:hypothetical protein